MPRQAFRSALSILGLLALPVLVRAQGATPTPAPPAPPATEAPASEPQEPLVVIHGYLTQAFGQSDQDTILGLPKNGTTDYRRAALLVRGRISENDHVVFQIAQRRLGEDRTSAKEPDLKLDWAFYEHHFQSGLALRVGRMPNPIGIYSENRYVGTLLPFYRAPYNFYQEGTFVSETVDGVGLWHTLFSGSRVPVDLRVVAGGFDQLETGGPTVTSARTNNSIGGQLWVNTPLEGLRVGFGAQGYTLKNSPSGGVAPGKTGDSPRRTYTASFDLTRDRFKLRSEFRELFVKAGPDQAKTLDPVGVQRGYYVYGGVGATEKLWIHAQYDTSYLDIPLRVTGRPPSLGRWDDYYTDLTLGMSYAFRPDVVVKGEYHWTDNWIAQGNANIFRFGAAPYHTNYFLLSLSASF